MSVQAMSWVLEHSETTLGSRLVLLSIANHARADGGGAWPSIRTLAREARLSERQVTRVVGVLERDGHISVERGQGPHGTHLYSIRLSTGGDNLSGVEGPEGVTNRVGGVTSTTGGGDRMSPEPSLEPSLEPKALKLSRAREAETPNPNSIKQRMGEVRSILRKGTG